MELGVQPGAGQHSPPWAPAAADAPVWLAGSLRSLLKCHITGEPFTEQQSSLAPISSPPSFPQHSSPPDVYTSLSPAGM